MAKVLHNQSFLDVLLQNTGSIQSDLDVALQNNLSITDDIVVGSELKIINAISDPEILNYYNDNQIIPAFGLEGIEIETLGIGKMALELTFIVA